MAQKWMIELDTPVNFPVEPGYQKARYGREIQPDPALSQNFLQEPNTGLIFLKPSFHKSDFAQNLLTINDFYRIEQAWTPARRRSHGGGTQPLFSAALFSNIPTRSFALLDILIAAAIMAVEAGMQQYDALQWALESNASFADDESFAIIYHISADEINRYANLMSIQWDKWQVHISGYGILSVWEHTDRQDLGNPNKLRKRYEFELETVQGTNHRVGFLTIIPCPWGMIIMHQSRKPRSNLIAIGYTPYTAGAAIFAPLEAEEYATNSYRLWRASKLRIALNPTMQYIIGVHRVRFPIAPAGGTIVDGAVDPSYKPSVQPQVIPIVLLNGRGTVSGVARTQNGTDPWQIGDRVARVALSLSTTNSMYTPFLAGYGISWNTVYAVRDTEPVFIGDTFADAPGHLVEWEYGINIYRQRQATLHARLKQSQPKQIAQRGDATAIFYEKEGADWVVALSGLAKEWEYVPRPSLAGIDFEARFAIYDAWERMDETHLHFEGVCDGLSIKQAIDNILMGCGLPSSGTPPQDFPNIVLPAARESDGWRFFPRAGATGRDMIKILLQLASKQWIEWYLEWDIGTGRFEYRKRAYSPTAQPLILSTQYSTNNPCVKDINIRILPPVANLIVVAGATGEGESAKRIIAPPAINRDSIYNPNSPDFLGRVKAAVLHTDGAVDTNTAMRLARRAYDLLAHRRQLARITLSEGISLLAIDSYLDKLVEVWHDQQLLAKGWCKRITIQQRGIKEGQTILELDSVWEGLVDEK